MNKLALHIEALSESSPELEVELRRINKRLLGIMRRLARIEKAIAERGCNECEWHCETRGSDDDEA